MDHSGKTFSVAAELTGARLLACWSQHHSTLERGPSWPTAFISTNEPKVKQVPKPFFLLERRAQQKKIYYSNRN